MTLREYCVGAGNTDLITDEQAKRGYYYLGLCGEAAEVAEKIAQKAPTAEIAKELGDCTWYIVRLMYKLKGIEGIFKDDVDAVTVEPHEEELVTWTSLSTHLTITAGKIAERYKKIVRDRDGCYTFNDIQYLHSTLLSALRFVHLLALELGYKLSEVLEMNLAKLASRQARNLIHGSGDNR